jgi:hypothetical protein
MLLLNSFSYIVENSIETKEFLHQGDSATMNVLTVFVLYVATLALALPITAQDTDVSKRQYTTYGLYGAPVDGYGFAEAAVEPAGYVSYPPPAGGCGSYGVYRRAVDGVRGVFY